MENITSMDELKNAIQLLEVEQAEKLRRLKEQSLLSIEIIKPMNLFKSAVKDMVTSHRLFDNMLDTGVGLATGFITQKIFIGSSANVIRKLLCTVLQLGITEAATKNSDFIKSFSRFVFQRIFIKNGLKSNKPWQIKN
jgi:hypothetical protein